MIQLALLGCCLTPCSREQESVLVSPPTRECWFRCVTEMLLLCNEAAARFAKTQTVKRKEEADGIQTKPLGLEYMADRLDTDDPIMGYMVRTKREGWLQGFITFTTFTTWHKDFEWNSLVKEAGISDDDKRCFSPMHPSLQWAGRGGRRGRTRHRPRLQQPVPNLLPGA
jgi:hypothetical protein